MSKREPLFSLTAKDFVWSYTRGTGSGGQKRNKTSSAVHCSHPQSGSHGYSEATRSQLDNKIAAFMKCVNTPKFKAWLELEMMRRQGVLAQVDAAVEREMKKVRVEGKDAEGRWTEL